MDPRPRVRTFIRVFERSSSLAAHVDTDAGEFVVKVRNNPEGPRVLINEWVGTSLARVLDVPTPEFAIVDVPSSIELPLRASLIGEAGPAFGSRFERAQPWAGESSLQGIANPEAISRIVVLDTWARNFDRYSVGRDRRVRQNRRNLLLSAEGAPAGRFLLKAIDQGHCFGGASWRARHLRSIEAVRDSRSYGLFPEFVGHLNAAAVEATLAAAAKTSREEIRKFLGQVPPEWALSGEEAGALEDFLIDRAAYLSGELQGILWPQGEIGGGKSWE